MRCWADHDPLDELGPRDRGGPLLRPDELDAEQSMPQPSHELGTLTVAARRPLPERRMPTGLEAAEETVVATVRRTLTSVRAWRGPADPGARAVGG